MGTLDWIWITCILLVWAGAQAAVVWSLWHYWRKRDPEPERSWGDGFDNWYPDYPFNDYTKRRGEKVVQPEPDKHEEEE